MKKKFSVLITLLLAFVLCFSLAACKRGGNDNPPEGNEKTVAAALTSLRSNLDKIVKANGFTLKVEVNADTKNTAAINGKITAEKRGDQIRLSKEGAENDDVLLDLASGYIYLGDAQGFMYRQVMPSGYVEGLKEYMAQAQEPEEVDVSELFVYDEETSTLSLKADFKEEINSVLTFMQTAYADQLSLKDVLDEVIKVATDNAYDLESGIDFIVTAGVAAKDNSVEDLMQMLETASEGALNFDELLADLDPQVVEMIKAMKVGQLLEGMVAVVNNVLPSLMEGPIDPNALTAQIMGYLFPEEPYDTTTLQADLEGAIAVVTTMLDAFKVNELVDMIGEQKPELKAAFTQGFAVTDCKAQIDFVFDETDALTAINASCSFAHNFSGVADESFTVLGDNDYTASFALTVSEIVDTDKAPWTIDKFFPDQQIGDSTRIVVLPQTGDVNFLVETGSAEFSDIEYRAAYCYRADDEGYFYTECELAENDIVYDVSTKTYTVKRSFINSIKGKADYVDGTDISINIYVTVKGQQYPETIYVYLCDFAPELITYVDFMSGLFGNI